MGRRTFLGLGVALTLALSASAAEAAGRILTGMSGAPEVSEVRLARAASPEQTRLWAQYRLEGAGRVAIVTPVRPGTYVDPVPDAWFEALEAATAPRVVPPSAVPACGNGAGTVHVTGDLSHVATVGPSEVVVLTSASTVQSFAAARDLSFGAPDLTALAAHVGPFVALVYEPTGSSALTEAVRFVTAGEPVPIPLALAEGSGNEPDVTLWTIGDGRARIEGATEHTPDSVGFGWIAKTGESDYPQRRRELLVADHGAAWLIETTGSSPLFQFGVLPKQNGAIPPVVSEYFERAALAGFAPTPSDSCLAGVWDARAVGKGGAVVAERCPKGMLAAVPPPSGAPSCDPAPAAGEIDAETLVCGEADDLAHALAGGRPDRARITRHRGVIGSDSGNPVLELFDGTALPRVLTASEADLTGCGAGGGSSSGGSGGTGAVSGSGAYGGSYGYGGSGDGYYEPEPEPEPHTDVTVSCWGSSEPGSEGDSCSGDSSSSSESDDSCSGDTSDSAEGGDSCGGDTSDSAEGGDACSGDTSDSTSSGDSCSGDSGSSSDSCSGDTSSGSGDCSISVRRPRRVKVSLWLIVGASLAFGTRRWGRRRRH